jgi:hypothetical protein
VLLEAVGCTSDESGLGPPSRPQDSFITDKLVALRHMTIMSSRRTDKVFSTRAK